MKNRGTLSTSDTVMLAQNEEKLLEIFLFAVTSIIKVLGTKPEG